MSLREDKAKLYSILICVIIGLIILFADLFYSKVDHPVMKSTSLDKYGTGWNVTVKDVTYSNVVFPQIMDKASLGDTLILTKQLPDNLENDTFIFFRASHQYVKVYIDNEKVYSFGWGEQRLFGKSPGCAWITFPVSKEQAGSTLQVELTGTYQKYSQTINEFYIGDKSAILYEIVNNRLGSVLVCVVLIIIGFGMIIIALSLKNGNVPVSLFRLGILSALVGIWSGCTANILQVLYGNVFTMLNLEFFTFNMLLPVSLWFLFSFEHYKNRKVLNILFWISISAFIIISILQLINVADYMETIIASHILMGITVFYLAVTGVRELVKKSAPREVKLLTSSVLMLLIFMIIDILRFYLASSFDDGFYTRIGMLVFVVVWAVEIIRNMSKLIVKMTQTQMLEVLAYEDQMTGLKNRTAFEEILKEYRDGDILEDAYIVAFDVNDLKNINDNFGHAKGDQAIIIIANIIKTEFEDMGTGYRIGGDEICVIVSDVSKLTEAIIHEKIDRIANAVKTASAKFGLDFSVASGYSKMTSHENRGIDHAYKEADKRMYESKQKMKNSFYV